MKTVGKREKCCGITKAGRPCQRNVGDGQLYCESHLNIGYIYVYTVSHANVHVYDHQSSQFKRLQMEQEEEGTGCWTCLSCFASPTPQTMLIKVGYTSKTPKKRMEEWKNKCMHSPVLLGGGNGYNIEKKGWITKNPLAVEKEIHRMLRSRYGKGHVECHGCSGTHIEWFLLPSAMELKNVYKIIGENVKSGKA